MCICLISIFALDDYLDDENKEVPIKKKPTIKEEIKEEIKKKPTIKEEMGEEIEKEKAK